MKIFQIIAAINKEGGGPSYTVPSLCNQLVKQGGDVELNILGGAPESDYNFDVVAHKRLPPSRLGVSPAMRQHLLVSVKRNDIIHSHGLWMMPNIYPGNVASKTNAKLIVSPRGMLAQWSLNRNYLIKKAIGLIGQNKTILRADCLHVTAESEYEEVRSYGYKGPVAIIPNGVDMPAQHDHITVSDHNKRKIIFISRVHPKKGIEILIESWKGIAQEFTDWELVICGPGDQAYVDQIEDMININSSYRMTYQKPVYGDDKERFYQSASLFVLPTYNENFGVVVAEALSYSVPVIVSKGAPWGDVENYRCGWWIDNSVDQLQHALRQALRMPERALESMGNNGRRWMQKEYSWDAIGQNMYTTYQWLRGEADIPDCIRMD